MTATIERTTSGATSPEPRSPNRILIVAVAVLAALVLALGVMLVVDRDSAGDGSLPPDVEEVLEQLRQAEQDGDFEAYEALVTPQFRRPEYRGDPFGSSPYRNVVGLDYFERVLDDDPEFDIVRVGDPIVVGDGPWYVSYEERWEYPAQDVQYEAVYTYVVVERDGAILVDDGYWAGHSVPMP